MTNDQRKENQVRCMLPEYGERLTSGFDLLHGDAENTSRDIATIQILASLTVRSRWRWLRSDTCKDSEIPGSLNRNDRKMRRMEKSQAIATCLCLCLLLGAPSEAQWQAAGQQCVGGRCSDGSCSVPRWQPKDLGQVARSPRPVAAKPSDCVVKVLSQQGGTDYWGSGFLIDQKHVLTCWHILRPGCDPVVIFADNTRVKVKVIGADHVHDIALLEFTAKLPSRRQTVRLADKCPAVDTMAWADGYYHGRYKTISGRVLGYDDFELFMDGQNMDDTEGMSGGPLYTRDGVVAVLTKTRTLDHKKWETGGPEIGWLRWFIKKHTQQPKPPQNKPLGVVVPVKPIAPQPTVPVIRDIDHVEMVIRGGPYKELKTQLDRLEAVFNERKADELLPEKLTAIQALLKETREKQLQPVVIPQPDVPKAVKDNEPVAEQSPPTRATKSSAGHSLPELPWGLILAGAGLLTGGAVPAWYLAARRGAKAVRTLKSSMGPDAVRGMDRDERREVVYSPEAQRTVDRKTVVVDGPTSTHKESHTEFVNVESNHYQRAHELARQHIVRRYPGSQEIIEAELHLTRQFAAGMSP